MIKLKSLFRRGPAQSSSGTSSKHSSAQSKNSAKSRSTTSLNSTGQDQASNSGAITTKLYPNSNNDNRNLQKTSQFVAAERGVDVGNDIETTALTAHSSDTPTTADNSNTNNVNSNTLPLKSKTKAATKRQKQPKQLPIPTASGQQQQQLEQQQQIVNNQIQQQQINANVMTTIAVAPGSINSAASLHTAAAAATVAAANNNYHSHYIDSSSSAAAAAANQKSFAGDNVTNNDLFKMNSAAAANYNYGTEQQHQMQEATHKMQELQTQLERLGRENIMLEAKIAELIPYQNEVGKLKNELLKMQSLQDKSNLEITNLKYENESLRNRLRDVVNSPLSDAEKHQIIQDSQRLHSSAPASIALPSTTEHDGTPCVTPDWDKHSSSSEISVACLQDKIIQMEETHYSTNEELQATLQELADLQAQLSETQTENERLSEEKDVLFQSLCRQTEKLNETRTQINTLQDLLLRDAKQAEIGSSEREKKLLDLIKTSQEEREAVLVKQEDLNTELQELRQSLETVSQDNVRFRERISLLDSTIDAANAERKQMEAALLQAKEEASQQNIEIKRLTTLLDNARAKVEELEQDLARGEKTDLSEVLDAARKEKDALEERAAELQDQCSRSQAEISKLKDQLSVMAEECKVAKNNAKCALSHLEYRYETLQQEKDKLGTDYQQLLESTADLQAQCKCHVEDKTKLQNLLKETQKQVNDLECKVNEKEEQLEKEIQIRKQEAEEWQQFQSDLLMTVRVANDFKTEALSAREQLVLDNKTQKEKIRLLEQQIEKLTKQQIQQTETQQSVLSTVQQEMASRRSKIGSLAKQDSRLSVKSLIETIENNKQSKVDEPESHYSSSSSLNSGTPDTTSPNILPGTTNVPNEWTDNVRIPVVSTGSVVGSTVTSLTTKGPLREQQQQQTNVSNNYFGSINNVSKPLVSGERKDPLNMLAKNGGSKRNALLKWCQNKTVGYRNIDITNFSSSWNDGLAFCAILHSYLPDRIPYDTLSPANKRRNFSLAFAAAESVGILTTLNINDMCQIERPDWTQVMTYVTAIYKYFET